MLSFGELIRASREDLNLSLREVSKKICIDTSLLGKIERDVRQPTKEHIKRLAEFYKLDERKLLMESLSDQIAYKIIDANAEKIICKVAEKKVEYFKLKKEKNECIKSV
jgi:transcriptional regulator with XRE-family HTH domain